MHKMRQCSSVLLVGGTMLQSLSGVSFYQRKAGCVSSVLLLSFSASLLSVSLFRVAGRLLCLVRSFDDVSLWTFTSLLLTLRTHTLTLPLSLARFPHCPSILSVFSPRPPPPPLLSFSLALPLTEQSGDGAPDSSLHRSFPLSVALFFCLSARLYGWLGMSTRQGDWGPHSGNERRHGRNREGAAQLE